MDPEKFLRLLGTASSGRTVRVWCYEIPIDGADGMEEHQESASPDPKQLGEAPSSSSELSRAVALASAKEGARYTPREWAELIPTLVERELRRAIQHNAVSSEARGEGKGHAATVIPAGDLVEYLATCESVVAGRERPPVWWTSVRYGPRALVRGGNNHAA